MIIRPKGPGVEHPEWQTIVYEAQARVKSDKVGSVPYPVAGTPNALAGRSPDDLLLFTNLSKIRPGTRRRYRPFGRPGQRFGPCRGRVAWRTGFAVAGRRRGFGWLFG